MDQDGFVLDVLVQSRRGRAAAQRLLRRVLKKNAMAPRVVITDKLGSYGAARPTRAWASSIGRTKVSLFGRF
ncbi:DDE domain-containing protein [Microvirga sp. KLBC 81]|nr:DDE domain-containing protein [Microvirga sp. KLBC 81]